MVRRMARSLESIPSSSEAYPPRLVLPKEYSGGPDAGIAARYSESAQYWDLAAMPVSLRDAFATDRDNHVRREKPRPGDGIGKIRSARYQQRRDRVLQLPGMLEPLVWRAPYKVRLTKSCRRATKSFLAFNLYRDKRTVDVEIVPTKEAEDEMGWNQAVRSLSTFFPYLDYAFGYQAWSFLEWLPHELRGELIRFINGSMNVIHPVWGYTASWPMSRCYRWGPTYDYLWWYFGVRPGRTLSSEQLDLFGPVKNHNSHELLTVSSVYCSYTEYPDVDIESL